MLLTYPVLDAHGRLIASSIEVDDHGVVVAMEKTGGDTPSAGPVVIPAIVDVHCHGGGGYSFPDDYDLDAIATAVSTHRRRGTTHLVASLVSMADPLPALEALVKACDKGLLVGIHMEGPYVSPHKPGAQNPAVIRNPDLDELRTWLETGRGWIKTMTLAPELPQADKATELLIDYGAKPSWGHTNATSQITAELLDKTTAYARRKGYEGSAQTATHLFNAMPSLHHREPGPIHSFMRAASRGECVVEVIGDGVHIEPSLAADVIRVLDDEDRPGAMLITDAMAGAGMPDGDYQLGGLDVTIESGVATLSGTSTIAGGTACLGDECAIAYAHGLALDTIVRAVCLAPIQALDLSIDTQIEVGKPLTAVLLDELCRVVKVYKDGRLYSPSS